MKEIKFEACRNFPKVTFNISTDEFTDIATAFQDNVERVHYVAELPAEVNYWSQYFGAFMHVAHEELGIPKNETVSDAVNKHADEQLKQFLVRRNNNFGNDIDRIAQHQWDIGSHNFSSLVRSDTSGQMRKSAQATFAAMVTSAWASLETLSIDLWVAALNKHPDPLGLRVAQSTNNQKITLAELAGMNFNLKSNFGEFLYRNKKVSLDKFKYIRNAYSQAFGDDWDDVFKKYPMLTTAETIRHLYAHRSGRVDKMFVDRLDPNMTTRISPRIGQVIDLDGDFVSACVEACVRSGLDLLSFVDKWSLGQKSPTAQNP